jgi:hypothetical protein
MFTHPYIGGQIDRLRHRETLADVRRHRLARRLRDLSGESRRGEGTRHRQRRAWRSLLRLRTRALT